MSNDYTRHAHRRTILAEMQRVLMQRFIGAGGAPPKEQLICEEVFFSDREVTQETLLEVLEELQRREADERIQMTQFEFRRRDGQKFAGKNTEAGGSEADEEGSGKKSKPDKPARGSAPSGAGG